ncbi:C39 family peptidase [Mycobacterium sp. RTGN5]|uniref:C39 family peptidase n=1 Tax=Mycobacterium sp. RTGN5 TaxID=3016522 RepID=UPI0029C80632|nr:C39 family peptidase [Mycobacterium sp. RTGN5]
MVGSLLRSGAIAFAAALTIALGQGTALADPSGSSSGVYGDPAAAAPYWAAQSLQDNCGAMSVGDIVGQLTGERPTEAQILMVAEQTPSEVNPGTKIYKPNDGGISVGDLPALFKHYGITSVNSDTSGPDATGLNALEQYLGAGRKVIAFVNYALVEETSDQRTAADHFVVVTGVDTNKNVVHLNDPAADEANTTLSIPAFMKAWDTSNDSIIVTAAA